MLVVVKSSDYSYPFAWASPDCGREPVRGYYRQFHTAKVTNRLETCRLHKKNTKVSLSDVKFVQIFTHQTLFSKPTATRTDIFWKFYNFYKWRFSWQFILVQWRATFWFLLAYNWISSHCEYWKLTPICKIEQFLVINHESSIRRSK